VIDYKLWFDDASGGTTFYELSTGITSTAYTATSLIQGSSYQFKVQARNDYGYSTTFSATLTVLAA
jgi:hypothetical protein